MRRRRRTLSIATALAALAAGVGVAVPAGAAPPSPRYVVMGDSYSAGNGTGTYEERTCWRSPDTYAAKVAAQDGADLTNVACSGGVVADITQPRALGSPFVRTATYEVSGTATVQQRKWLQRAEAEALCGTPAQPDWHYEQTITSSAPAGRQLTATVSCQLTAAAQVDAVTPRTDAVFLTVGGNDIGFSSIVLQCLVLRSATGCKGTIDAANATLPTLKSETVAALTEIRKRSRGNAEVYLLGYPHLINTDSYRIPEAAPTYDAGRALHDLQLLGDDLQREGVAELDAGARGNGGFTFVDVKPAWGGMAHGIDPRTAADNSQAWLVPVLAPGRELPEWVHPTVEGHTATASALTAALR
ncbi:SGNH/GDSL hydrolase family protein [Janibacter indicus]|uniref:SGNH/GDSL hydrolase family protein n=1 Tax=Janibacter indicus TaxID=857417 RepID=UPI003EBC9BCF